MKMILEGKLQMSLEGCNSQHNPPMGESDERDMDDTDHGGRDGSRGVEHVRRAMMTTMSV